MVFLAAHPDDETLACGALIARMSRMGADVEVVIATGGQRRASGSYPLEATRAAEAEQALSALGVRPARLVQLRFEERLLERDESLLALELEQRLRASDAEIVITTSAWEPHPDHAALGRAARSAASSIGSVEVYEYLIWAWISVGDFIDMLRAQRVGTWRFLRWSVGVRTPVGPYQEAKRSALSCYRSQVHRSACERLGVDPAAVTVSGSRPINTTVLSYLLGPEEVLFRFDAHRPRRSAHLVSRRGGLDQRTPAR